MDAKVSGVIFNMLSASASTLQKEMNITKLFDLTGSMDSLTIKFICMINQTNNNEVYTVQNL